MRAITSKDEYKAFGERLVAWNYCFTHSSPQLVPHRGTEAIAEAERITRSLTQRRNKTVLRVGNNLNKRKTETRRVSGSRTSQRKLHNQTGQGEKTKVRIERTKGRDDTMPFVDPYKRYLSRKTVERSRVSAVGVVMNYRRASDPSSASTVQDFHVTERRVSSSVESKKPMTKKRKRQRIIDSMEKTKK